jgi:hypothetical protein
MRKRVWLRVVRRSLALFPFLVANYGLSQGIHQTVDYYWPMDKLGTSWITLRIPRAYLPANFAAEAADKAIYGERTRDPSVPLVKDLLLVAIWPSLSLDDAPEIRRAFESNKDGRLMVALLQSGATADFGGKRFNSLDIAFNVAYGNAKLPVCLPAEVSRTGERHQRCVPRNAPDLKPAEFGLERIGLDFSKHPGIPDKVREHDLFADDLYFKKDAAGHLLVFIQCGAVERGPENLPGPNADSLVCTHRFISKKSDSLLELTYRRRYLHDWQTIQSRWDALTDSFVVSTAARVQH